MLKTIKKEGFFFETYFLFPEENSLDAIQVVQHIVYLWLVFN
jgi:hypothetical protein